MVIVCVRVLSADSQLYAFIKTLPSVSTATSFSLLLFYNFTYHPHLILQGGVSILSLFFSLSTCSCTLIPSFFKSSTSDPPTPILYIKPPHLSSPPSSPCTPPSPFAATCGRSAQAVLSILVLYCQCIVASNPVKMPWEYCINLPPRLSFYTPPHLSKKSQLLGNS